MSSPVDRIANVAAEPSDEVPADSALSERLDRLAARHGEIAWPENVAAAMAELGAATRRAARLVDRVSRAASSLGSVAAEVSPQPGVEARDEPPGSGASSAKPV